MVKKAVIAAVGALTAGLLFAAPATAEPGNPCELAINFLCRFVPVAPELDHDIDLTQQQAVDPNAPPPDSLPPANPCAAGCI
ncbi:fibronectin-binding protein [Mycobacterium sp. MMS18-G62]